MTSPPSWTRYSPAQQPAAWLAGSGALLVMVATLSATAARWDHIPVPARLAGLLVLHIVVITVAERSRQSLPSVSRVMAYLAETDIRIVPIGEREAGMAIEVMARFGKGMGHPAQLNMGDCFAYACARTNGAPLLFKGDDFSQTDIESA